ncbi:hypothetical protein [Noviherbaspirillum malthae]|jgi:hypothetical protein|uniref:hypothetical protein n=1 Tax=Noviherbaspirillum malthae TaxID=1260987 RepID=UPI00188FDB2E|nr:hypothetical protein [Noviherbaspirillum malthae]
MFGPFAVYARNPHIARQVYESVRDMDDGLEPFGTVTLDSGETVDWIYLGATPVRLSH